MITLDVASENTYIKAGKRGFTVKLRSGSVSYEQGTNTLVLRPNDMKRATNIFLTVGELEQLRNAMTVVLDKILSEY